MERDRTVLVATGWTAAVLLVGWVVLRFGSNDPPLTGRELAVVEPAGDSVTRPSSGGAGVTIPVVEQGRTERGLPNDAEERSSNGPQAQLASTLRVRLAPPSGRSVPSAQIVFRGVPDGAEVSAATAAGQDLVELAVRQCYVAGARGRFVGLLEVDAAHHAKYRRWMTAEDVAGAEVAACVVQLELAHELDVLVVDQFGRPASGAVVLAYCDPALMESGVVPDWRVEANSDGRAALRGLARGDWEVYAGAWKDWGPSEKRGVQLTASDSAPGEIVLSVTRWASETYSSGAIELPAGWSHEVDLQDCTSPQRSFPVFGDEFFVRIARLDRLMLRAVEQRGGRRTECFQIVGGEHGTLIKLVPE